MVYVASQALTTAKLELDEAFYRYTTAQDELKYDSERPEYAEYLDADRKEVALCYARLEKARKAVKVLEAGGDIVPEKPTVNDLANKFASA